MKQIRFVLDIWKVSFVFLQVLNSFKLHSQNTILLLKIHEISIYIFIAVLK